VAVSIPADASPANLDWERFLRRAPKRSFESIRLFRWRNYRDYDTGVAGDLFVHLLSGLHFATGSLRNLASYLFIDRVQIESSLPRAGRPRR
jgi:hypothetical protein